MMHTGTNGGESTGNPGAARSGSSALGAGKRVRVLIADDSQFMRRAIEKIIRADAGLEIVGEATNGKDAIEKCKALKPDVLTLDIEMPVMDGLTALERLRVECSPPPAVLVCSSLTKAGSEVALKALRKGAADVIAKDASHFSLNLEELKRDLCGKIHAVAQGRATRLRVAQSTRNGAAGGVGGGVAVGAGAGQVLSGEDREQVFRIGPSSVLSGSDFELCVIASSTGGPPVLETILTELPRTLSVPVVIAQHMPALFTKSLAERLAGECAIKVVHGEAGMTLEAGTAYVLPGGEHGRVHKAAGRYRLEVSSDPAAALYKPSANELFASASKASPRRVLAIVLTGMGDDGCEGAKALKSGGATVLAQDAATSVVYGMPRAVVNAGVADGALPPEQLARLLAGLRHGAGAAKAA